MTPCKLSLWVKLRLRILQMSAVGRRGGGGAGGVGTRLQPAPGGSPRDRRLEARRRDSDRGSREEEPKLLIAKLTPSHPWNRGAQDRRRRAGDCRTIPGAGREPAELGEEARRPGAEHAAPACSARVHPARRGGDRAEAVAPGRCLGPGRLHVSPARGHVHRLSPVRRPNVLRINKMKLGETGGQLAPGSLNPRPRPCDLPSALVSRRNPSARLEPRGNLQPLRAPARPRPLAGPGALCRSH
ncbi:uncharacterized protein V5649_021098 [Rhynchonycteris naso]